MTIGTELRSARERLGLTREQISSATKVQLQKIEALEGDEFGRLPAGIYLEGIVAAYARQVRLDVEAMLVRVRMQVAPPPALRLEDIALAHRPHQPRRAHMQFNVAQGMQAFGMVALALTVLSVLIEIYPARVVVQPDRPVTRTAPATAPTPHTRAEAARDVEVGSTGVVLPLERTATHEPLVSARVEASAPVVSQGLTAAEVEAPTAIAQSTAVTHATATPQPSPVASPTATSQPRRLAQARAIAPTPMVSRPTRPDPSPESRAASDIAIPDVPARARQSLTSPPVTAARASRAQPHREPATALEERAVEQPATLAGTWTLETTVESSSMRKFEGLRLGYRLELRQVGDRIEGVGRKVKENGVPLRAGGQTPIQVHGTFVNGRLSLTFGEQGARRASGGTFELTVEDPRLLRGYFESDAARSAGTVHATRL